MEQSFFYKNRKYTIPDGYEYVKLDDERFKEALAVCFDGDYPIVTIAGPGGCGKSVIYRIICDKFPLVTLPVASTGVAAFNIAQHGINCSTIHSALRIGAYPFYDWNKMNDSTLEALSGYEYLLIDEISMVDCNLLDYILSHVNYINGHRKDGKSLKVILFGDVLQLPPVSPIAECKPANEKEKSLKKKWQERYGNAEVGYWFFSPIFRATKRITIELQTGYRQSDDSFKEMLNVIRFADKSKLDDILSIINTRKVSEAEHRAKFDSENSHMLFLTGRNRDVRAYNERHIQIFRDSGAEHHDYTSSVSGPFTSDPFYAKYDPADPQGRKAIFNDFFPILEDSQTLYLGQQVMCICNDKEIDFQNGTLGTIVDFAYSEIRKDYLPVIKTYDDREPFKIPYHEFSYFAAYINDNGKIVYDKIFTVNTLACKCAYAVTFHKSQGLTLDSVYIDTRHGGNDSGEESFIPDSGLYMGLSRCRTLGGIGLSDTITPEQIRVNEYTSLFFLPDRDKVVTQNEDDSQMERMIASKNILRIRKGNRKLPFLSDDDY